MKYFLVALFDNDSNDEMNKLQKRFYDKNKIYKDGTMHHIFLGTIENPDIDKLDKIMLDILKPFKKFKVFSSEIISLDSPYKSINLRIENKGYIARLARNINSKLLENGFYIKENPEEFDLHVSLANNNFTIRDLSNKEYAAACQNAKKEEFQKMVKVEKIELWRQVNNKKDMVVKSYNLRDFM